MGQLVPYNDKAKKALEKMDDEVVYEVDIKNLDMRTIKQNAAMHKWFTMLAEELNRRDLPVVKFLKVEVDWTPEAVKELLWKPVQKAMLNKGSTTALEKSDIDKVYETLNAALYHKHRISIPFPKKEME